MPEITALAVRLAELRPDPDYATAWLSASKWQRCLGEGLLKRRVLLDLANQERQDRMSRRVGWVPFGRLLSDRPAERTPCRVEWEDLLEATLGPVARELIDRVFWHGERVGDVGVELGLTFGRASQIKKAALAALRERL